MNLAQTSVAYARCPRALKPGPILAYATGKTVMTTIQKFQEITGANGTWRRRAVHPKLFDAADFLVMVGEAHRTQYRSRAAHMRQTLPTA